MFSICVLIVAAAAVYMVEAYIHTYYAIEYMHGTPLFFVLLAKYAAPAPVRVLCVPVQGEAAGIGKACAGKAHEQRRSLC